MDKINNIIDSYKDSQEKSNCNRADALRQLFVLRKKTIRLVDSAKKTLQKRCDYLSEINNAICEVQGHSYSDWEEHAGFLDRSWYYTRECLICGKKEMVDDDPFEYEVQSNKKIKKI